MSVTRNERISTPVKSLRPQVAYNFGGELVDLPGDIRLHRIYPAEEDADLSSRTVLNVGPSHPATHGTIRMVVELDGEPIRASKQSAQWCLDAVDVCWKQKVKGIRAEEQPAAAEAFDVARRAYAKILSESQAD